MTPEEKAKQLRLIFHIKLNVITRKQAKKCALIAVDQILDLDAGDSLNKNYWEEVKTELKKL
jgi:hypothetical protein